MKGDIEKLMQAIDLPVSTEDQEQMKKGMLQREMVLRLADAPAPYRYYTVNYDGFVHVAQQVMADRNNLIFDWWNIDVLETGVDPNTWTAWAMVKMTASLFGQTRSITQRGVNKVTIRKDSDRPTGEEKEQAIKSAISDGMKKCSSWYGVFSHVFRGDVVAVLPKRDDKKEATNEQYIKLINHFKLREKDVYYGIPILPDKFKDFYSKMGWEDGIFQADFINVCYKKQVGVQSSNQDRQTISQHQAKYIRKLAHQIDSEASDDDIMLAISRHLREIHQIELPADAQIEDIPKEHYQKIVFFWKSYIEKRNRKVS